MEPHVGRISRLFRDVVEVEKLRTHALELTVAAGSARDLVARAVARSAGVAADHHVRLEANFADVSLVCDKERILRVLLHLVSNAIEASPADGRVTLHVADNSVLGPPTTTVFSVKDEGAGIDPREWPYLFDEKTAWSDPVRKGDGLGLSVCRAIVEAHGGRIWCESHIGRGTIFRFALPS